MCEFGSFNKSAPSITIRRGGAFLLHGNMPQQKHRVFERLDSSS
jgi:hypothetical protein